MLENTILHYWTPNHKHDVPKEKIQVEGVLSTDMDQPMCKTLVLKSRETISLFPFGYRLVIC